MGLRYLYSARGRKSLPGHRILLSENYFPSSWISHQNQAVSLSLLGRYDEAEKANCGILMREFKFEEREFMQSEVAPDIQAATGHTAPRADRAAVLQAAAYLSVSQP